MNLVLSGPIDTTLLNLCVGRTKPREVVRLHDRAHRLVGADHESAARRDISTLCEQARVDHAFVEEGLRFSDFKLLAMDMDSTLITIECIDEIADFAGKKKEVAAITEAAMRGEIPDFAESLRRRVALLADTPSQILSQVYAERLQLNLGALDLLTKARLHGIHTLLLSGGFTYFTNRLRSELSLDEDYANTLDIVDSRLTGHIFEPVFDAESKASIVRKTLARLNLPPRTAIAIGDGANDIPMFLQVAMSIAFHAKPLTKHAARHLISFGGLDVVLDYLE